MRKSAFGAVLCVLAFSINAATIYNYQGNPFDVYSFDFPTGSGVISGTLELPDVLEANLDWANVSPTSWSFTDGLTTATDMTGGYTSSFQFSTNGSGQIIDWRVLLLRPIDSLSLPTIEVRTRTDTSMTVSIYDESTYCVELTSFDTCANGTNAYASSAGEWSVVPIPPAVWLLSSGLLGLIGVARRRANA